MQLAKELRDLELMQAEEEAMHARLLELSPLLEPAVAQAELSSARLRIDEVAGMQEAAAVKLAQMLKHLPDQQFDLPALVWRRLATRLPPDVLPAAVQSADDDVAAPAADDDVDDLPDSSELGLKPPDSELGVNPPDSGTAPDASDSTDVGLESLKASTSQAALRSALTHDSALGPSLSQQSDPVRCIPRRHFAPARPV